jgi:hypothetical protein
VYLLALAVVAYVVTPSAHCASDWTFSKVALAGRSWRRCSTRC